MLRSGASMKTTLLSTEFTYQDYLRQAGESRMPILAIDPNGRIAMASAPTGFAPKPGWKVVALAQNENAKAGDAPVTVD